MRNMPKISKLKYLRKCLEEAKEKMQKREMCADVSIFHLVNGGRVIDIPISLGGKEKICVVKDVTINKIHHYILWHSDRHYSINSIGQDFNVAAPVNALRKRIQCQQT